jgi:hypothetical protein
VRHAERLYRRWRLRAVRRGPCRRSSCTGQLARIRARRSSGGRHLLRRSIGKNSHATRALAERSAPQGVRPHRETMVALDGAVHGSLAAFTAVLGAQASDGTGTGVSDCVLGSTARDISGSNPSRSTGKSAKAAVLSETLSRRHRRSGRYQSHGFQRLVRRLSRWALVHDGCASQPSPHRPHCDGTRSRRSRRRDVDRLWRRQARAL